MFRDISPQMAGLVGIWCNTLLYGITVVAYGVCMYMLVKHKNNRTKTATWMLIVTSTIQFTLSTIYVALSLKSLIEGFIDTGSNHNAALLYWINPAEKSRLIGRFIYGTNSIVGDCVLIWRVYMVWGKNIYVCILPIMLTVMATFTGYVGGGISARFSGNPNPTSVFEILNWILANWCMSIATQAISTGLIVGRIWWHARRNPETKSRYLSVIAIIVESGAIYTVSTVFLLAFFESKTQDGAIIGHITTQIATIAPTLIIIRVDMSRKEESLISRRANMTDKGGRVVSRSLRFGSAPQRDQSTGEDTLSAHSPSAEMSESESAA